MPDSVSSSGYAIRRQEWERDVESGLASLGGRLEADVSRAASVRHMQREIPLTVALFGLHIKTQVPFFVYMSQWDALRSRSILEAPSLGSEAKRLADKERVMGVLRQLPGGGSGADNLEALRITALLDQTIVDNREIRFAQGQMGAFVAA